MKKSWRVFNWFLVITYLLAGVLILANLFLSIWIESQGVTCSGSRFCGEYLVPIGEWSTFVIIYGMIPISIALIYHMLKFDKIKIKKIFSEIGRGFAWTITILTSLISISLVFDSIYRFITNCNYWEFWCEDFGAMGIFGSLLLYIPAVLLLLYFLIKFKDKK